MVSEPVQIEAFAGSLVQLCNEHAVDAVVSVDNSIDSIVGHVLARELGVSHGSVSVDLGRLETKSEVTGQEAIVVVALASQQTVSAEALQHFLGRTGRKVVVIGLKDQSSLEGSLTVSVSP